MDESQETMGTDENVVSTGATDTGEGASPQQPRNLEDAFRLLREDNGEPTTTDIPEEAEHTDTDTASDSSVGGSSVSNTPTQPTVQNARRQPAPVTVDQLQQMFRNQAHQITQEEFGKRGISQMEMGSLYERDENTGRVFFNNPDDPQHPFNSRVEAMQYVNAFNENYRYELERYEDEVYNTLLDQNSDVIALLEFNPIYEQMPQQVRDYFDALVEPYQQQDNQGVITFPGADFNILARQAYNMAQIDQRRAQAQQQQQQQQQTKKASAPSGPALDLKGGASSKKEQPTPRNLAEAMRLVNEQRADERKRGKK